MEEFKVGDKVLVKAEILEINENLSGRYKVASAGFTSFVYNSSGTLIPRHIYADYVYPIPIKTYEDGLREAWEMAKKIICNIEYGGLHTSELEQIFGYTEFDEVLKNYTPQEASAKIAEWERKQEIRVGDILQDKDTGKEVVVSHTESREAKNIFVIFPDGSCGECEAKDFTKTGRTIDIAWLLAQIGGMA